MQRPPEVADDWRRLQLSECMKVKNVKALEKIDLSNKGHNQWRVAIVEGTKECVCVGGKQRERNHGEKGWWSLDNAVWERERNAAGCAGRVGLAFAGTAATREDKAPGCRVPALASFARMARMGRGKARKGQHDHDSDA